MRIDLRGYRARKLHRMATRATPAEWFAWRPVQTSDGQWVWLETIWRKYLPHVERWAYYADYPQPPRPTLQPAVWVNGKLVKPGEAA